MPDDLVISGGGSYAVGTEQLFDAVSSLDGVHRRLGTVVARLAGMTGSPEVDDATRLLARAHASSEVLRRALALSAEAYGAAERASEKVSQAAAAEIGYGLGFFLPLIALQALPAVLGIGAIVGVPLALLTPLQRAKLKANLSAWVQPRSGILSDPAFVRFVRLAVTSLDDTAEGLLHLPPGIHSALAASGLIGVGTTSAGVIAVGAAGGALKETKVSTLTGDAPTAGSLPVGWADRASRIPDTDSDAQVRIDRYVMPDGSERFDVYVSGTRDFALGPDDQPFDMTSNLAGIAGQDPGSLRAVEQAMTDAGITQDTPVLITGHSQGGLVAAMVAASGDYNVLGVYTLGAPAGTVPVPGSIPWVAVEHTNDIVPALAGPQVAGDPIVVTRELYDRAPVSDRFFPAHQLGAYESTAAEMDQSTEPRILDASQVFQQFTDGATPAGTSTWQSVRDR